MSISKLLSAASVRSLPPLPELNPSNIQSVIASDGATNDYFGTAVRISGNGQVIIVGAHGDDAERGSAYIYTKSGEVWTQVQKIQPSDSVAGHLFGFAVALTNDGQRIVISSQRFNNSRGRVYVYDKVGAAWTLVQTIDPYYNIDGRFGTCLSLSLDGSVLAVGAPLTALSATNAGMGYIYETINGIYVEKARFQRDIIRADTFFANDVSVSGNGQVIVFGMRGAESNSGGISVFHRISGEWVRDVNIFPWDAQTNKRFGFRVSADYTGTIIAVGADGDSQIVSGAGALYIYKKTSSGWTNYPKIRPSQLYVNGGFGYSVAINRLSLLDYPDAYLRVAVGSIRSAESGFTDSGAVRTWRFNGTEWVFEHLFSYAEVGALFGFSTSITAAGDKIVSGARAGNGLNIDSGLVRIIG